jgi:hypothetical protein
LLLGDISFATIEPGFERHWTVRKVGSALARAFASRFFLARPVTTFCDSDLAIFGAPAVTAILRSCRFRRAAWAADPKPLPLFRVAQAESLPGSKFVWAGLWTDCG